ncbi:MAG: cisplatin damage response ATP-dependent DNA ligase [Beijerinckiaceae bacterium]|nr:cisplatin damage response ATP-dependent DNA ligase [Beijerinckiaceae bacterium]MCZ8299139.1 cisplatin damage response ATP-dependent DNA ligase [Beijerinckiaceae bacterium]
MNRFAALIEALAFEPRRLAKLTLMEEHFRSVPDPDRGYCLAALCGALDLPAAKPAMLRQLISERTDPVLFALSYDYVGDLSETIALLWPAPADTLTRDSSIGTIVETLQKASRREVAGLVAGLLDTLDERGRWALLKLMTGGFRIGVSASLAKLALARFGRVEAAAIEEIWHGLEPPYAGLFAWLEGRGPRPDPGQALTFRSPMLAHPVEDEDFDRLDPHEFSAEWKWDGIRVQAAGRLRGNAVEIRLFSRSGDDITTAFPDLAGALHFDGVIDGELVVMEGESVAPFSAVQQRLNRKSVSARLTTEFPAHLIAYDCLFAGEEDLRSLSLAERRERLDALVAAHGGRLRTSPPLDFDSWEDLARQRAQSAEHPAIEGVMLKRLASPYLAGRPKGHWYKWKRDPGLVDCVLMYAQRGHGKRSSYYSDFTFGVWDGDRLVPVGKAYFGFSDAELIELDRFVRQNTTNRFGPVREVVHEARTGLVLEIAFEGLQASTRHKSGIAMRFPRIHRIRWDKPPAEADRLTTLQAALARIPAQPAVPDA